MAVSMLITTPCHLSLKILWCPGNSSLSEDRIPCGVHYPLHYQHPSEQGSQRVLWHCPRTSWPSIGDDVSKGQGVIQATHGDVSTSLTGTDSSAILHLMCSQSEKSFLAGKYSKYRDNQDSHLLNDGRTVMKQCQDFRSRVLSGCIVSCDQGCTQPSSV